MTNGKRGAATAAPKDDLKGAAGGERGTALSTTARVPKSIAGTGLTPQQWEVLTKVIFPTVYEDQRLVPEEIDLAIAVAYGYCRELKLDIFKKPVNIVAMWNKQLNRYVPQHWPAIALHRTVAARTKEYAGKDEAEFGPTKSERVGTENVTYPEFCKQTLYRLVKNHRVPFTAKVLWIETYASKGNTPTPNYMWMKRPYGQLAKCAEAAALREAFPEELGGQLTAEEMEGQKVGEMIDVTPAGEEKEAKEAEEADKFDLVNMDGEVEEHESAEVWLAALGELVETAYPAASAEAARGNWETNSPMFQDASMKDHSLSVGTLTAMFQQVYGKLALAAEESAGAGGGEESATGDGGDPVTSVPPSPLKGGQWETWVPWFAGQLRALPREEAQLLVVESLDELEAMSTLKGKNADASWNKMLHLFDEAGVDLPSEGGG